MKSTSSAQRFPTGREPSKTAHAPNAPVARAASTTTYTGSARCRRGLGAGSVSGNPSPLCAIVSTIIARPCGPVAAIAQEISYLSKRPENIESVGTLAVAGVPTHLEHVQKCRHSE